LGFWLLFEVELRRAVLIEANQFKTAVPLCAPQKFFQLFKQ